MWFTASWLCHCQHHKSDCNLPSNFVNGHVSTITLRFLICRRLQSWRDLARTHQCRFVRHGTSPIWKQFSRPHMYDEVGETYYVLLNAAHRHHHMTTTTCYVTHTITDLTVRSSVLPVIWATSSDCRFVVLSLGTVTVSCWWRGFVDSSSDESSVIWSTESADSS